MKNKIAVNDKLIDDLSRLAKLKFDKHSSEKMKQDLDTMLDFIGELEKVNTDNIEPLVYLSNEINVLREDKIANMVSQKNALKNAPQRDSDYFKVPKVLKK